MTVAELIEQLRKLPQDATVMLTHPESAIGRGYPADEVIYKPKENEVWL